MVRVAADNMFFSMLGSFLSQRKDFTRVITRKPAQTEPFESDTPGYNTRFSLFDLEQRERFGKALTKEEQKYLDYIRSL